MIKQTVIEINGMFLKGIMLSSGTLLTGSEMYEIAKLIDISNGIASYEYVKESIEEAEIDVYPPIEELPIEVFEEINYAIRDGVTGDDEYCAVVDVMKRREKANG